MNFSQWLKANKGRPIDNLTDDELERYATEYGSFKKTEGFDDGFRKGRREEQRNPSES